jgi:hypothetical protein
MVVERTRDVAKGRKGLAKRTVDKRFAGAVAQGTRPGKLAGVTIGGAGMVAQLLPGKTHGAKGVKLGFGHIPGGRQGKELFKGVDGSQVLTVKDADAAKFRECLPFSGLVADGTRRGKDLAEGDDLLIGAWIALRRRKTGGRRDRSGFTVPHGQYSRRMAA